MSSRLLEYEVWTRLNALGAAESHNELTHGLLGQISFLELAPTVLARTLQSFPIAVRTLDAIHLSSVLYLIDQHQPVSLLTYDRRMEEAARALEISLHSE